MRRAAPFAVLAATTALLVPASAHAVDRDNRCLKYADRYRTVELTKFGVIFWKRVGKESARFRMYYGCIFSRERARRLPGQKRSIAPPGAAVRTVRLDGRFAAYGVDRRSRAGRVLIYDLKRGELEFNEQANDAANPEQETHNDVVVLGIAVNAGGAAAWISYDADFETPIREVHVRRTGEERGRAMVDRGTAIETDSLAKSRDELTVYWLNGGEARSAPLD